MISFENVAKIYDAKSRPALEAVTLDVARDEFVFLVGASGSGKSTLLQLILREQKASRGRVLVAGRDVSRLPSWKVPHLRRQIGAVFQDFRLLPNKTAYENVAFALQVIGKSRSHIRSTVPEVLETVGLGDKMRRMPHELSGGEQQRVAIARAIANKPVLLLADEPTGNLDPTTSLGIMRVLDRIHRSGTTVVMATHDDTFVNAMRKRVIELSEGRIVRDEDFGEYTTTHIPVVRLTPPEEEIVAQIEEEEALVDAEAGLTDPDAPQASAFAGAGATAAGEDPWDAATGPSEHAHQDEAAHRAARAAEAASVSPAGWVPQEPETVDERDDLAGSQPEDPVGSQPADRWSRPRGRHRNPADQIQPPTPDQTVPAQPSAAQSPAAQSPAARGVAAAGGVAALSDLADSAPETTPKTADTSILARHLADRLRNPQPQAAEPAVAQPAVTQPEPETSEHETTEPQASGADPLEPTQPSSAEPTQDEAAARRERRARRAQRSGIFRRR